MIQIEAIESDFGTINISKNPDTGVMVYDVGGVHQSSADRVGVSLASYIHAIFGLLTQAKARDILVIGGGGGTLGTMLAQAGRSATLVDVNPASFAVARQYFGLPAGVLCQVADGEQFLRAGTGAYDAIVLDAFHGEAIPPHLQSPQFFALARARLTKGGALFANLRVKHDFDDGPDRLAASMNTAWADVRVLDATAICNRNAIVMAGEVLALRPPGLLIRPKTNADIIDAELRRLKFRGWKTSRWDFR